MNLLITNVTRSVNPDTFIPSIHFHGTIEVALVRDLYRLHQLEYDKEFELSDDLMDHLALAMKSGQCNPTNQSKVAYNQEK